MVYIEEFWMRLSGFADDKIKSLEVLGLVESGTEVNILVCRVMSAIRISASLIFVCV